MEPSATHSLARGRQPQESLAVATPLPKSGPDPEGAGNRGQGTLSDSQAYCGLRARFLRVLVSIFPRHDVQRQPLLLRK